MVLRRIGAILLGLLLVVSLIGANVAIGADRGPLNAEYVKSSAEEHDLYGVIHEEVQTELIETVEEPAEMPLNIDLRSHVTAALTVEYIQSQVDANIDRVFAYLHGEEELEIIIEVSPVLDDFRSSVETELATRDPAEFGIDRLTRLLESEASYNAERTAFREEVKAAVLEETGVNPDDHFGSETLANLTRSEDSYRNEQEAFKAEVKASIQEETERELSDSELETAYEQNLDSIQEAAIEEVHNEIVPEDVPPELNDPLDELVWLVVIGLSDESMSYGLFMAEYTAILDDINAVIDQLVEEAVVEHREEIRAEIDREVAEMNPPEVMQSHLEEISELTVDALVTDMPYEEYHSEFNEIQESMASDVVAYYLDEDQLGISETILVGDEFEEEETALFERIQWAVSVISWATILLPVISFLLIAGIYALTRSVDVTALISGVTAIIAGASTYLAGSVGLNWALTQIDVNESEILKTVIEEILPALLSPLWTQSLLLVVTGVFLLCWALAYRRGIRLSTILDNVR